MDNHRVDADRFKKNDVAQRSLDEMLVFHRAATVFDDKRTAAKLLDERQCFDECFDAGDFGFVAHGFAGDRACCNPPHSEWTEWKMQTRTEASGFRRMFVVNEPPRHSGTNNPLTSKRLLAFI